MCLLISLPGRSRFDSFAGRRGRIHRAISQNGRGFYATRVGENNLAVPLLSSGAVAHAVGADERDFSKGENLLKQKQYAEARASLKAGMQKDPSNVQAHLSLAEACRSLEAWACAEEHYETALQLDAKSGAIGSTQPR